MLNELIIRAISHPWIYKGKFLPTYTVIAELQFKTYRMSGDEMQG